LVADGKKGQGTAKRQRKEGSWEEPPEETRTKEIRIQEADLKKIGDTQGEKEKKGGISPKDQETNSVGERRKKKKSGAKGIGAPRPGESGGKRVTKTETLAVGSWSEGQTCCGSRIGKTALLG